MNETSENTPPTTPPAQPPAQDTPPAQPPATAPPAQPVQSGQSTLDLSGLLTALNAMPERVANAVRESSQPATAPKTTTTATSSTSDTAPGEAKKGRSFADKWFGTNK